MPVRTTWGDISAIVAGLIMEGSLSHLSVNPDEIMPPFNEAVLLVRKRVTDPEKIVEKIGVSAYREAMDAAKSIKGVKSDWPVLLQRIGSRHRIGQVMMKVGSRLVQGEDADLSVIQKAVFNVQGYGELIPASQIIPEDELFAHIGWGPIDKHVGGLPKDGLTTISSDTGTGKTWLLLKIAESFARRKKKFGIFSLELSSSILTKRLAMMSVPKKVLDYILINDDIIPMEDIGMIISRVDGLAGFGIDFADLVVKESSEQTMAALYWDAHRLCRELKIHGVMLAQFRRTYNQALPTIQDIRYTGMSEKLSKLVILGHNPSQAYIGRPESLALPYVENMAYLIIGKSTHGFVHGGVGAIQIDWKGSTGWGDQSNWFPLAAV